MELGRFQTNLKEDNTMLNKTQFKAILDHLVKEPQDVRLYEAELKEYATQHDDPMFNGQQVMFMFINGCYDEAEKRGLLHDKWEEQ